MKISFNNGIWLILSYTFMIFAGKVSPKFKDFDGSIPIALFFGIVGIMFFILFFKTSQNTTNEKLK